MKDGFQETLTTYSKGREIENDIQHILINFIRDINIYRLNIQHSLGRDLGLLSFNGAVQHISRRDNIGQIHW